MKSAKEMFEELNFKMISENPIVYRHEDGGLITEYLFNPVFRSLQIKEWEEYNDNKPQGTTILYIEHIEAINEQIKELNWND